MTFATEAHIICVLAKLHVGILQMSDFINAKTDELFTENRWMRWIDHFETRDSGVIPPDNMYVDRIARKIHDISLRIPNQIRTFTPLFSVHCFGRRVSAVRPSVGPFPLVLSVLA